MKSKILFVLTGLVLVTQAFANCPEFDIEGKWKNGHDMVFNINQPTCRKIEIIDDDSDVAFAFKLNGKNVARFEGSSLKNAPEIMSTTIHKTAILKSWGLSGEIIDNPIQDSYSSRSNKMIVANISAQIALPKPGVAGEFYQVLGSVNAQIEKFLTYERKEGIFVWFYDPKVSLIDGNDGSDNPFMKGFLSGINFVLSLYFLGNEPNDLKIIKGTTILKDFIDRESRTLYRIQ